jgi:hypothetical protein
MARVSVPVAHHLPAHTLDIRLWRTAFLALIILECVPVWVFHYFPSQDGPSHLHNASVLAHYGTTPIYQQYYRIVPFAPAGNMLTQFLMAALLKVTEPQLAEKVLLSSYFILFFVSFRYMLRALTPYADYFAVFSGILVPNFFLYKGFWNFSFSVSFLMLTIGYYLRQQSCCAPTGQSQVSTGDSLSNHWGRSRLQSSVLLLAGLILYLTHIVSWVICILAVAVLGLPQLICAVHGRQNSALSLAARRALLQYSLPICSLLPPIIFMLSHLAHSQEESVCAAEPSSFRERLWPLYSLSFLNTIAGSDPMLTRVVAITLLIASFCVVGVILCRRQYHWPSSSVLALSLICAALVVVGPDCVGSGSYIHQRVALFALLFFIVWLASALPAWPRLALNVLSALFCAITVITFAVRVPVLSELNRGLSDFVHVGQKIRPGSTVLALCTERHQGVDPFRHAVGLLTAKTIIDLRNYEASTDYFTTRFQADRSPFPALGTPKQLEAVPPVFDIRRYERETTGRVDYILCYGSYECAEEAIAFPQDRPYRHQISGYTLVQSMPSRWLGHIALYQRTPAGAIEGAGEWGGVPQQGNR